MIRLLLLSTSLLFPGHLAAAHDPISTPLAESAPPDARAITESVRTGEGDWTFESVAGWAKIPEGKTYGPTHGGVAVTKSGEIFTATDGPEGIAVFAPDGTLARTVGKEFSGCHSLLVREEGGEEFLYAAHLRGHQVVKLRLDGTAVWTLGAPMESKAYESPEKFQPTSVAVAPDGTIFVADGYGTSLIHLFDAQRKWVKSFAGAGTEDGKVQTCHGIAIDARGKTPLLLVCDRENRRLVRFDLAGKFVDTFAEDLRRPCAVSFLGDAVAVAELAGRVTILDGRGKVLAHLGDNPDESQRANFGVPPASWKDGIFTAPHGLAFDGEGDLLVQDWNQSGRISKLRRK
ncbi:MAG: 6-bladed beta-propeller [Planctomycetota bacterium]